MGGKVTGLTQMKDQKIFEISRIDREVGSSNGGGDHEEKKNLGVLEGTGGERVSE